MNDREIDALIAEKVMGLVPCDEWQSFNFGSAGGPALMKKCTHKNDECYPTLEVGSFAGKVGGCPRYSTDISAAWRVVLKVCEETRWYELTFRPTGAIADFMGDNFHRGVVPFKEVGDDRTRAQCKAICLAALKAVDLEADSGPRP